MHHPELVYGLWNASREQRPVGRASLAAQPRGRWAQMAFSAPRRLVTVSSFVLPPTPGNETKSPERNFHPQLIKRRISLITFVDRGDSSASSLKERGEKKKSAESVSVHCFYYGPGRV